MTALPDSVAPSSAQIALTPGHQDVPLDVPGASIASLRIIDPGADCFLIVPALGTPARSYRKLGESITALGLNVVSFDLRGVGSSGLRASRRNDWGYDDLVEQELYQVYALAQKHLRPQARIFWVGHSLGGQLALLHQRYCTEQPASGVALIASGSPWYRHYPLRVRTGLHALRGMIALCNATLGFFPGDRVGFGGRQPARLMRQWSRFAAEGLLPELRPAERRTAGKQLNCLSLLAMKCDTWAPEQSMRALAAEADAAASRFEMLDVLPDGSAADHFSWLRQPGAVAAWLQRIASTPTPAE